MDRFQRFQTGSRTGRPVCGSSGSRPIGAEPEPEPVMTDAQRPTGSRTAKGADASGVRGSGSPAIAPRLLNLRQPVRRRTAPLSSTPELQQFIDAVIIPALLERLLGEHEPTG